MSALVYPANLPGLTFDNVRSPGFNTGVQTALSGKESRIAYQQYARTKFTLKYELLRDYTTPSDLAALHGLFMAVGGKYDTFLYSDPTFNTVALMPFAVGNTTAGPFQITASFQNSGGPGGAELIQNFNGTPSVFVNGVLQTPVTNYTLGATGIVTFTAGHFPAAAAVIAWTGSFYYRCRFDDDSMDFSQFMNDFWSNPTVVLQQVKL